MNSNFRISRARVKTVSLSHCLISYFEKVGIREFSSLLLLGTVISQALFLPPSLLSPADMLLNLSLHKTMKKTNHRPV